MALRIHQIIPYTKVEGPGARFCIQVQGCPIQCKGCAVPFTWPEQGGYERTIEDLAEQIVSQPDIEGVTFLGGEPFAQAGELAGLAAQVQAYGLSVMTFTGYQIEQLYRANNPEYKALLDHTDLLIDGPFIQDKLDLSRPWTGSSNQRYHFLSGRYLHLKEQLAAIPNRLEVRIRPDGRLFVNGMATLPELEAWFEGLLK